MGNQFTVVGVVVLAALFWIFSQNANGKARQIFNLFLLVLLVSMILTKWDKIKPIIIKEG